ncbi:MAG: hypothetical protein U0K57_00700 [Lachnospiraceae bacterium]|nr:hypothetical protein [Lachnospiraceae bacterium]
MGSILENLHKFHIDSTVDSLNENGGNKNVEDHPLDGVYQCKICGYIYDEAKEGKPFTTLSHCPICNVGQQGFKRIN